MGDIVPRVIPAIKRALDVLELFLEEQRPLSVPEIVKKSGLPRTTTHEIVNTLLDSWYLRRDEAHPKKLLLGHKVLQLGNAYTEGFDLIMEGRRVAEDIVTECEETVQFAILEGTQAVFIGKVESMKAVRLVSRVGSRLPAHCTAVGKMLLSAYDDMEIRELYGGEEELLKMTANSITTVSQLLRELDTIRQRRLAYDDCESNIDVRCVSAPVYNYEGTMVAAISISVPITRMSLSRQDELAAIVAKGAAELSRSLGYTQ
jgi:IclR family KDG regulon transcriptional repressor